MTCSDIVAADITCLVHDGNYTTCCSCCENANSPPIFCRCLTTLWMFSMVGRKSRDLWTSAFWMVSHKKMAWWMMNSTIAPANSLASALWMLSLRFRAHSTWSCRAWWSILLFIEKNTHKKKNTAHIFNKNSAMNKGDNLEDRSSNQLVLKPGDWPSPWACQLAPADLTWLNPSIINNYKHTYIKTYKNLVLKLRNKQINKRYRSFFLMSFVSLAVLDISTTPFDEISISGCSSKAPVSSSEAIGSNGSTKRAGRNFHHESN